jgi:MOSC domain-containing protein YiiM
VIGEKWHIGDVLVLQPTFGRVPCATFQAKMAEPHWVKRFAEQNRPGAYLRVVTPGEVKAGDPIEVRDRPAHGVTIADAFRAYVSEPEMMAVYAEIEDLPEDLRQRFLRRLR